MVNVTKISDHVYVINPEVFGLVNWLAVHLIVGGEGSAVVDPGPNITIKQVLEALSELNISNIRYIALTHIHLDHGGGTWILARELGNVKVVTHPRGVKHLINPSRLWEASREVLGNLALRLGEPEGVDSEKVISLGDGEVVDLGGVRVRAIHTPGHAPHHIAYFVEPDDVLIAGDALANLFDGRIYPVTVPPFNLSEYLRSLDKLAKFNPRIISVAHFGIINNLTDVFIQRVRDKAVAWAYIIAKQLRNSIQDPRKIYEELLSRDLELNYIVKHRENHELTKEASYRAILGMFLYIREVISRGGELTV